jgi:hypothetical protein
MTVSDKIRGSAPAPRAAMLPTMLTAMLLICGMPPAAARDAEFDATVVPFLAKHCVHCHGAAEQQADMRLDLLTGTLTAGTSAETGAAAGEATGEGDVWAAVYGQLERGEMPPEDEPTPDVDERDAVLRWIRDELRRVGMGDRIAGSAYPERGNYLDHRLLFGQPATAPGATRSRLWRISPFQYEQLVRRFFAARYPHNHGMPNPLGLTSDPGFRDYAFRYVIGPAETQQLYANGVALVTQLVSDSDRHKGSYGRRLARDLYRIANADTEPTPADVELCIRWLFDQLMVRQPTDEELARYGELTAATIATAGGKQGLIAGLAPIFIHPDVLYRSERGAGPPDEHGRRMLSSRELAFAIAYALTDHGPDEPLRHAVLHDTLADPAAVRGHVERMLDDPAIEKPRILRFFQEYFGYDQAPNVFKDVRLYEPHFGGVKVIRPPNLVRDTDLLVLDILERDRQVLRELLTTNRSFVQSDFIREYHKLQKTAGDADLRRDPRYRWLGMYYNLPPEQWSTEQPLELPATERAGILTQPSWLFANSNNVDNHPIHRGEWVFKRLLGGTIPDVPITVDAKLPEEPHHTLRERMRFTLEDYCWRCHKRMNPIGLTFEMYDQYGQFRTAETVMLPGAKPHAPRRRSTVPVDSQGGIEMSPEPSLDGPADNAIQLLHRLAESEHVEQVFVRHAFRYWMGRNEKPDDAAALQAAQRAYRESDGSMRALLVSLLTSDPFVYRIP